MEPTTVVVRETKRGVKTSEFWVHLVLQVIFLLPTLDIWKFIPDRYAFIANAVLGSAYMLSRGQAKSGVPDTTVVNPDNMNAWATDAAVADKAPITPS
jgi:hypothetical protein